MWILYNGNKTVAAKATLAEIEKITARIGDSFNLRIIWEAK